MTNSAVQQHDRDHEAMLQRQALVLDQSLQHQAAAIERDLAARYPAKPKVRALDVYALWVVFAAPGLISAVTSDMGFGGMLIGGLFFAFIGGLWAACCPISHWLVRYGLNFFGTAMLISAVISIFLPLVVIALITILSVPWAIIRIWKVAR